LWDKKRDVIYVTNFDQFNVGNPNVSQIATVNIALWGFLFGIAFILSGSLAIPIGIHITWNLFQGNVFGFPVSGVTFPAEAVTFISIEQRGPELWTGGTFGPEAGLLCSLALIVGIILILGLVRFRQGNLELRIKEWC